MIIGLPLTDTNDFSPHFGAAVKAGLFTVDLARRRITRASTVTPPTPQPCGWADWLGSHGVTVFLAGAIGQGALQRMAAAGIEVIPGLPPDVPALLVQAWINRQLKPARNGCQGGPRRAAVGADDHRAAARGAAAVEDGCCCTRERAGGFAPRRPRRR